MVNIDHSQGSAEVVFARRSDAYQALKRYNNVQLDGKPMKIEIVAPKPDIPLSARVDVGRANGRRTVVMMYVILILLSLHCTSICLCELHICLIDSDAASTTILLLEYFALVLAIAKQQIVQIMWFQPLSSFVKFTKLIFLNLMLQSFAFLQLIFQQGVVVLIGGVILQEYCSPKYYDAAVGELCSV